MTTQSAGGSATDAAAPTGRRLLALSLGAVGIVYGDIGTSPLYAIRDCFHGSHAVPVTEANVLGVLSLIFWSLVLIISVKYLIFILRADNRGEGGILSLTALLVPNRVKLDRAGTLVILLGLVGAALLYAEGMLTPAVTVLSAVEGLSVATPFFERHPHLVVAIAVVLLIGLFAFQSRGTTRVGIVFGPIVCFWFLSIAVMGLWQLAAAPEVWRAINPYFGYSFFRASGWDGFLVLGAVFLVVTGGEALYADLGHFGRRPIRVSWFCLVLPALLLNYFGQGALLLRSPEAASNPFFLMAPTWALYPLVLLATVAATIASQAVITGAFSLTLQAIRLGYIPRLRIEHTSSEQMGQIYLPTVNWWLMIASILLVVGFQSSSNLTAAYGLGVTLTMSITSVLFYLLLRRRWGWSVAAASAVAGFFLAIELSFLAANLSKVAHGGWFPLLVGVTGYVLMSTWRQGRMILGRRLRERQVQLDLFVAELMSHPPHRVPGTAVFLFSNPVGTPPALRQNVLHNQVLHERVAVVCVQTADVPHVPPEVRAQVDELGEGFYNVTLSYGFMEEPDVPQDLRRLRHKELNFESERVSYFLGRETLLVTNRPGMAQWRETLFTWMSRNAQSATMFFRIPPDRVIEVGAQVEL